MSCTISDSTYIRINGLSSFLLQKAGSVESNFCSALSVDSIIMSKPAGGPKVPQQAGNWDDDD